MLRTDTSEFQRCFDQTVKPDIYWIDGPWPGKLAILARPRGGDWLDDEIIGWKNAGVDVAVSVLTREEEYELGLTDEGKLVHHNGLTFISFPIRDYSVPISKDELRELVSKLDQSLTGGSNVGIHCRQGIGRSSLVAACVLVTSGISAAAAFDRISTARGKSVPDTDEQRSWVAAFASDL